MPEVTLKYGDMPVDVEYTPSSAVASGEVVVSTNLIGFAKLDIAANTKGTLTTGNVVVSAPGDAAIAIHKVVYWNNTANKFTETASGNTKWGISVSACSGDAALFDVLLLPGLNL